MAHIQKLQEWNDKHSDDALTRICLYGIGAHRVEVERRDGQKFYVVRRHGPVGSWAVGTIKNKHPNHHIE